LFLNDDLNGRFRFVFCVFLCFFACFVGVTSQFCYKECIWCIKTSVWEGREWKSYEDEIQSTTRKYNKKNNLDPYHLERVSRFKRNNYTI